MIEENGKRQICHSDLLTFWEKSNLEDRKKKKKRICREKDDVPSFIHTYIHTQFFFLLYIYIYFLLFIRSILFPHSKSNELRGYKSFQTNNCRYTKLRIFIVRILILEKYPSISYIPRRLTKCLVDAAWVLSLRGFIIFFSFMLLYLLLFFVSFCRPDIGVRCIFHGGTQPKRFTQNSVVLNTEFLSQRERERELHTEITQTLQSVRTT